LNKEGDGTLTLGSTDNDVTVGALKVTAGEVDTASALKASAVDLAADTTLKLGGDATVTALTGSGAVSADSSANLTVGGTED
jgi:hypothetical protein